jgi:hypothetical protein
MQISDIVQQLEMNSLLIEKAKTGRSKCGACKENIEEGEQRVGTQRWYPFKGFPCTTWHHRTCYDRPWSLSPGENIPASNYNESYAAFVKAARLVISPSVREFRETAMQDNTLCPITRESLDASNSHVHHFGPCDFSRIVKSFVSEQNVALHRISYTAAQFSYDTIADSFSAYHEKKKRYLLVHKNANLSVLKNRLDFGPCDVCNRCRRLTWIFQEGVCEKCRSSRQYRRNYMSCRQCRYHFGMDAKDLLDVEYQSMDNPMSKNFAPMRLYRRADVEKLAEEKFGSLETALEVQKAKRLQKHKVRHRNYKMAEAFHMSLRAPRSASIADDHGDAFATPGQLRYLLDLGAEQVVGLSKKSASEAIDKMKKSRMKKVE